MTEDQIRHMVDRFLAWPLPADFSPDDGISFDPVANRGNEFERRREPIGTNLLTAAQAKAMVLHLIAGMPGAAISLASDCGSHNNLLCDCGAAVPT